MPDAARVSPDLDGVRVAVTRPRHQCENVLRLLGSKHAYARCLPVVEILPPTDAAAAAEALGARDVFDVMIFVSANAVDRSLELLPAGERLGRGAAVGAVGPATTRALAAAGVEVSIRPPAEYSSEGLLEHPALRSSGVAGKRILVVKGEGGRVLIADTLAARGATVTSIDVYRRACPRGRIRDLLEEPLDTFGFIVITSGAAFENLLALANPEETRHVLSARLVVASRRLASLVRERGTLTDPIISPGPDDEAVVEALSRWWAAHTGRAPRSLESRKS